MSRVGLGGRPRIDIDFLTLNLHEVLGSNNSVSSQRLCFARALGLGDV